MEDRRDDFAPHLCLARAGEREYYRKQLATLKTFEEVEALCMPGEFGSDDDDDDPDADDDDEQRQSELAMKISNCANVVLLAFKVFVLIPGLDCATEQAKSIVLRSSGSEF